ncbi:MAG: 50S ribosomal protein L14 [Thermoprotei archaeon]|nr:MAG: 50S ribosomal protein L14 [Thermoprotei archaeon]RLF01071.1 MAG: 50S ribosomal protein L14 [Thermoprotei archaeon]
MAKRGAKVSGVSYRLHITPGIFVGSLVRVSDNSGAQLAKIIGVIRAKTVRRRIPGAAVGDMVVVSIREGRPELRKQVMRGIVIRQKRPYRRPDGTWICFEDNAIVIVSPEGDPKGSEIRGPVAKEAADRWPRIASMATMIV